MGLFAWLFRQKQPPLVQGGWQPGHDGPGEKP
jgi:hypothetical protein